MTSAALVGIPIIVGRRWIGESLDIGFRLSGMATGTFHPGMGSQQLKPEVAAMGKNINRQTQKEYTPEEVADVFKGVGSRLEMAIDGGNAVGKKFKATSYPTMMVVDKNGKVAHVNIGAKADIENILKGQLDALISGKSAAPAQPKGIEKAKQIPATLKKLD